MLEVLLHGVVSVPEELVPTGVVSVLREVVPTGVAEDFVLLLLSSCELFSVTFILHFKKAHLHGQ